MNHVIKLFLREKIEEWHPILSPLPLDTFFTLSVSSTLLEQWYLGPDHVRIYDVAILLVAIVVCRIANYLNTY